MIKRPIKSITFAALMGALLLSWLAPKPVHAQTIDPSTRPLKKVLFLFPEPSYIPAIPVLEQSVRETINSGSPVRVQYYYESFDSFRIPSEKYETEYVSLIKKKYEGEGIDLVIPVALPCIQFWVKHQAQLLPEIPIVFVSTDPSRTPKFDPNLKITGVSGKSDFGGALDLALRLHPEATSVVLVSGAGSYDKLSLDQAQKEFQQFASRVSFTTLSNLTIEEYRQALSSLPPKTIVFYLSILKDRAGNNYSGPEAFSLISATANRPIYGRTQLFLGSGIVGGQLLNYEAVGKRMGEMSLRVLSGTRAQDIPQEVIASDPMFDWRQLQKWGIDESRLPAGSIVKFKQPSFWGLYKWRVGGAAALIVTQSLLIILLLMNRAKRRKAEEESRASEERYRTVVETQSEMICRYLEDGTLTFVNDAYCRYFGKTRDQLIGTKFTELLPEQSREAAVAYAASLQTNPSVEPHVQEVVMPNGEIGWQEWVDHVVPGTNGHGIELQGIGRDITAKRRAEEELRLSEIRLSTITNTVPVLIRMSDADMKVTYFNKLCMDFSGLTLEELLADGWHKLVHEDDLPRILDIYRAASEHREPFVFEYRLRSTDGEYHWLYNSSVPRFAPDGEFLGYIGSCIDITERKLAEEAQRESEERFRVMADTAPVLIWISDATMKCTYFNQLCVDFSGLSLEELLEVGWQESIHEEDLQRVIATNTAAIERREPFVHECRVRHADGEYRWLYNTSAPRFGFNGELLGYIGSCVDITDRKLAEETVRESEERFRLMADTSTVLIWIADTDLMVTYFNQRILDYTGRTMEQLLGEGWLEIVHEDDRQQCVETYSASLERREPLTLEYRLRRSDGEYRWIYDTGSPRFTPNGEFTGYIGSAVDIHDRKTAEEALQFAHEEVSKLKNQLEAENVYLQEEINLTHNVSDIIGESQAIKYVLFKIAQVSQTNTTVLILGETGTGKELVARAIHSQSPRKDRPLVKVNCAALSATLIESELFGHEKGAFTGAVGRKVGRFELADGATIFLDEIGELPLELQSKLLRVLQEGEFERLGGTKTIKADVRVLAATNRNLKEEVAKGTFREDLWYRLNVFPISVPPLSQRKEDIPLMVEHFIRGFSRKVGKSITSISAASLKKLTDHSWPGNVRELGNVIERTVVTAQGPTLHISDQFEPVPEKESDLTRTLESIEKDYIIRVLQSTGWRIGGPNGASEILGLNSSTLRARMLKLGIHRRNAFSANNASVQN